MTEQTSVVALYRQELIRMLNGSERGTQARLARFISRPPGYISDFKAGRHDSDEETRRKMAEFFSADYDAMVGVEAKPSRFGRPRTPIVDKELLARIGVADGLDALEAPVGFRPVEIIGFEFGPDQLRSFVMDNDSMEPVLRHGDVLVADLAQVALAQGGVYLLCIDGDILVKRADKRPGGWVLRSENPSYYPLDYSGADEVMILGRVVRFVRSIA